ncbi:Uncharacterised protein [uncultured archaeon]|nr:Uncharacterised protein [uncultured archaeon]
MKLREQGPRGPDVNLMPVQGAGGQQQDASTGYEAIAAKVSKRTVAPSHLVAFFIHELGDSEERTQVEDRFFRTPEGRLRMAGERKPLNITLALFEVHPEWLVGRSPEAVKSIMVDLAGRVDLVDTSKKDECSKEEVQAVDGVLKSALALSVLAPEVSPTPPDRAPLLTVEPKGAGPLGAVQDFIYARRTDHGIIIRDLSIGLLDHRIIDQHDLRLFGHLQRHEQMKALTRVMKQAEETGRKEEGLKLCADFLNLMPTTTRTNLFISFDMRIGASLLDRMDVKKAAEVLDDMLGGELDTVKKMGTILYRATHPQAQKEYFELLGQDARVEVTR